MSDQIPIEVALLAYLSLGDKLTREQREQITQLYVDMCYHEKILKRHLQQNFDANSLSDLSDADLQIVRAQAKNWLLDEIDAKGPMRILDVVDDAYAVLNEPPGNENVVLFEKRRSGTK